MMDPKKEKEFLNKLRTPIHKNYIQRYILRVSEIECNDILKKYIDEEIIEESVYAKEYYVLKSENTKG
jgi:hypothetical protein